MRFASRENAVLGQLEVGVGAPPGAGAIQHLTGLLGRGRALEAVLTEADFDAELAERYRWVNRAVPEAELDEFVAGMAAGMGASLIRLAKSRLVQVPRRAF